ncbi:MAG: hypothetical protein P1V20_21505 [Verrucomicrobiales bacterium]|nr:hypothetical protein [Verrucomicrobiales bacterium]
MDRMLHCIRGAREIGRLRGYLLEHAGLIIEEGPSHSLVLRDPQHTPEAIEEVWNLCVRAFKEEVIVNMRLIVARTSKNGEIEFEGFPSEVTEEESREIIELIPESKGLQPIGNSAHEVLRVLMIRWFLRLGTTTLTKLGEDSGYTYKPVRQAVDKLKPYLFSGTRGIELKAFPREAWSRLILDTETVRETRFFHAKGEFPRTPAAMLDRFYQLSRNETEHVGIGGVAGAQGHQDIDLIGMPRLDFSVHCAGTDPDLDFLRKLDPALEPVSSPTSPCSVVVHLLRRPGNFFQDRLADPVECLLDLHEMRLDKQAREFALSFQPVGEAKI